MSDEGEAETADEAVDDTDAVDAGDPGETTEDSAAETDPEEAAGADEVDTEDSGAASEGDEADESEEPDGFQEGDFVRLAYTMRTVEDGTLVDTTDEEIAEEEGIDTDDQQFDPRTIVLGAGHIFEEVEDDIYGKAVGDSGTVTVAAEAAFGEYDPDQVRTVSADRIPEEQRHPGGHVDIDGQHGHVETIIGGRARVDFNHPLAGEDIEYEYEILDEVSDPVERARGLLDLYVDAGTLDMHVETDEEEQTVSDEDDEERTETVELETLYIESAPQLAMNQQWLFSKQQIAQEIIDRTGIDRIIVREVLDGTGGFGGMGGMLGGMGAGEADIEDALEDVDVDADEIVEELETDIDAENDAGDSADTEVDPEVDPEAENAEE